jgi:hypothetical protein
MHAPLRASDADREQLVDVLKNAFSEGRLTQDEYNARMEQAYAARTYGELRALVADLPGPLPGGALPVGTPGHVPYQFTRYPAQQRPANQLAVASMVFGLVTPMFWLTAIPAVVLGYKARRQIRYTGERGSTMAKVGLIMGWTAIGLFALLVALMILISVTAARHAGTPATGFGGVRTLPYYPKVGHFPDPGIRFGPSSAS